MSKQEVKPKASERLSAIESALILFDGNIHKTAKRVGELEMINFNLSRENEILKDALQLLNEKQLAMIALINEQKPLTDENLNEKVTVLKEAVLKEKLDNEVKNGNITPTDVVSDNSVLVGRELNKEGVVENPRLQFLVGRLVDELKDKFIGKKVGDLIEGEEGKLDIEISEIYDFVEKELELSQEEVEDAASAAANLSV